VSVVEIVGLEITTAISPHQLLVQLLDAHFKAGILLKKLSVALLNVLDGVVLGLHLADVLLQAEAQVSTYCGGLLKQGVDVLGVACCKRPTRMVGWKLGVANGGRALTLDSIALVLNWKKGDGGVAEDRQVALTELHEGLVGSSAQSVVEVVTLSHGKPSHHSRVSGVSKNVHIDLAAPQPKLMEWMTTVCGSPRVAKAVQHIPE
jgi:hypothetical protein